MSGARVSETGGLHVGGVASPSDGTRPLYRVTECRGSQCMGINKFNKARMPKVRSIVFLGIRPPIGNKD